MYSTHGQRRVLVALAATMLAATGIITASAAADTCPNAQFRIGPSAHLADCRAYEQISPPEKNGADAIATGSAGLFPVRASSADSEGSPSSSVVYMSVASYTGSLGSELPNPHLSSRTAEGWRTVSLAPPTPQATPPGGYFLGYDFSPDLSQFVLRDALQNPLPPGAQPEPPRGVYNLYVHHPDGSYTLVTTAPPTTSAPAEECSVCLRATDNASFAGASSDFSHVLFETNESLTPGAPPASDESLYESSGGVVRLVGVLPDGTIAAAGSQAGAGASIFYSSVNLTATYDINHAISADGSNVFFEAAADGGAPDPAQSGLTELYDRVGGSSTKEISAPAPGATPANATPEPARFWTASADGSLVFFTSSAELTTQSNTGAGNAGPDLYRYDVHSSSLTDLTVDANPLDAGSGANVLGVVGASEDGSYVYFVATGQLAGQAEVGKPNLYLAHAGRLAFIATLDGARDAHDWTSVPGELQAYVTPDGRHLAFMSANDPTGYDNRDQVSRLADSEVYEYGADDGALVCASCDPSGAPPQGNAFIGGEPEAWVSTPFYQPRTLDEDGSRLFFSSPSSLAPGASGSHTKVYEYESGAIHLISSGAGESDDFFLDASPSGDDVFFATRQPLLPSDQDDLVDIYDAHVGGGFPPAAVPAACAGSTCQGLPSAPPDFPSAISGSFAGAGNIPAPATAPAKAKAKKPKAKKKKKKKKPHNRRTGKRGRAGRKARHTSTRAGRARA